MYNPIKAYRAARARHIAHVRATQLHPDLYLKMERDLKWQPVKTALETLGLFAVIAFYAIMAYLFLAIA